MNTSDLVHMAEIDKDSSLFSTSYSEARDRILAAGKELHAELESFVNPHAGPRGEILATDVVSLGSSSARSLLFVCSGTHGVEGFAGSAIQLGLLQSGLARAAGNDLRIVLIHAINPFGFAWVRRFNEDNVDLNRNFLPEGGPHPQNPGYERLATAISPHSLSITSEALSLARLLVFAARFGVSATRGAVTGGQYSHPDGLFFGGWKPSWSAETLKHIVTAYGEGMKRVVFFDIHTGLGPFANAEIILNSPKASREFRRATAIWGDRVKSTKAAESVSADLSGTLKLAVQEMLPSASMTAASIEFGTVPALVALRALRAENWLHHFGDRNSRQGEKISAELLAAFVPEDESWRREIWKQGRDAVERATDWLRLENDLPDA